MAKAYETGDSHKPLKSWQKSVWDPNWTGNSRTWKNYFFHHSCHFYLEGSRKVLILRACNKLLTFWTSWVAHLQHSCLFLVFFFFLVNKRAQITLTLILFGKKKKNDPQRWRIPKEMKGNSLLGPFLVLGSFNPVSGGPWRVIKEPWS